MLRTLRLHVGMRFQETQPARSFPSHVWAAYTTATRGSPDSPVTAHPYTRRAAGTVRLLRPNLTSPPLRRCPSCASRPSADPTPTRRRHSKSLVHVGMRFSVGTADGGILRVTQPAVVVNQHRLMRVQAKRVDLCRPLQTELMDRQSLRDKVLRKDIALTHIPTSHQRFNKHSSPNNARTIVPIGLVHFITNERLAEVVGRPR